MKSQWEHFSVEELDCPCCHRTGMNDDFMEIVEGFRQRLGFPFVVSSGFRCAAHNTAIGGAKDSAHLYGRAVDIAVAFEQASELIKIAVRSGSITGVGIKQHGNVSGRYVHLDNYHDKLTIWSYQ